MADLTPQARAKIIRLLEQARREIAADVASTDWQAYHQPKLLAEIERHLDHFKSEAQKELKSDIDLQFAAGQKSVDQQVAKFMNVAQFPAISESALVAMQSDLATRLSGLTADAVKKIQSDLSMGLLGGKTPFETMELIGKTLSSGDFAEVAARAELIVKEEFGRVFRKAAQLRQEVAARHVSGLRKQWLHVGHPRVPRVTHEALHGKVVDIDQPFDLVNLKTGAIEHPMHPKDPILSAENSIGCGCEARPWKESWGLEVPDLPEFVNA
jgi:uncharacterized protein with gpF-like domain